MKLALTWQDRVSKQKRRYACVLACVRTCVCACVVCETSSRWQRGGQEVAGGESELDHSSKTGAFLPTGGILHAQGTFEASSSSLSLWVSTDDRNFSDTGHLDVEEACRVCSGLWRVWWNMLLLQDRSTSALNFLRHLVKACTYVCTYVWSL